MSTGSIAEYKHVLYMHHTMHACVHSTLSECVSGVYTLYVYADLCCTV